MKISVKSLSTYPLKSARGVELQRMDLGARGPTLDRRWMVVDANGTFVSQRSDPALATVAIALVDGEVEAQIGATSVVLRSIEGGDATRTVRIWGGDFEATDIGDEAADAFSDLLGHEVRVVYASDVTERRASDDWAGPGHPIGFPDGFPFLITSTSSLEDLERRAGTGIAMARFRANIVVEGSAPWDEDDWSEITIGGLPFRLVKPCARCTITTLDQMSGERLGQEPLKTLATFRNWDDGVMFGWNAVGPKSGQIAVGDEIEVRRRR